MSDQDGYRRKQAHHFQVHSLPQQLKLKNVLALLGSSSVEEAVQALQERKPAQLRVLFQKVYKTQTKSQNKLWLQRRLVEALRLKPSQYFPLTSRSRQSAPTTSSPASTETNGGPAVDAEPPTPKSAAGAGAKRRISPRLAAAAAAAATTEPPTPTAADFTFALAAEEWSDSADLNMRDDAAGASVQLPPGELSISPLPPAKVDRLDAAAEAERARVRAEAVADVSRAMDRLRAMREGTIEAPPTPQFNIPMLESPFLGLPGFMPSSLAVPPISPEDEPFLALDPLLVDLDMELLPDGSMW